MLRLVKIAIHLSLLTIVWVVQVCSLLSLSLSVKAQQKNIFSENGEASINLYTANEYKNQDENFAIAQDKRGIMYFGNFGGILEYDGIKWRTIPTDTQTKVSTLYYSKSGIMYVGSRDEFGYLSHDNAGNLAFKSLSAYITSPIGDINRIIEINNQIIFVSAKSIFILRDKKVELMPLDKSIESSLITKNEIEDILKYNKPNLGHLSTKFNTRLKSIVDIINVTATTSLVFTQEDGIYKLSGNTISRFDCPASALLANNTVTSICVYDDSTIAVWSARKGLALIQTDGSVKRVISYKEKINENRVNKIFKDKDSNIWLAMNKGLAHIIVNSPISQFSSSAYNLGSINKISRFEGKLCVATNKGLFYLDNSNFIPVDGINIGCWDLIQSGNNLIIASSNGIYTLKSVSSTAQRLNKEYSFCLALDNKRRDRVLVGNREGLAQIEFTNNKFIYKQLEQYDDNIINITTDEAGHYWLESISKGIIRFNSLTGESKNYRYTSPTSNLTRVGNHVLNSDQGIILYNPKGVFEYNKVMDTFLLSSFLKTSISLTSSKNKNWFGIIVKDYASSYWATRGDDRNIAYYTKKGLIFKKDSARFLPLAGFPIRTIYHDSKQVVWFGTAEGLLRFDLSFKEKSRTPFQAYIRSIATGDSTLFNGYSIGGDIEKSLSTSGDVLLNSQTNNLKFEFSATDYTSRDKLIFKYYLDNFEEDWSPWTSQNTKEYTNLVPGRYTFHVRAKNIYGVESRESTFSFVVKTPTYKSWWAVFFYILCAGLLLASLLRWRLQKAKTERIKLENLIKERTEEIVDQKIELEQQSEELAAKNDQLEKIDIIVQAINAEVDFSNLFQTILTKFSVIRNMDNGTFLLFDKSSNLYKFKALRGLQDLSFFESVELTRSEAESRYLYQAVEVYEDIFYKNDFTFLPLNKPIDNVATPKSLLTIVMKNEEQIEGFIILENLSRSFAFDQRDINMIRNLKEHLIAAYIKTRLLENLENTLSDLKATQDELIRQEKLASVGQLTKGIVDRILNPLNYVNNFAHLSDNLLMDIIDIFEKQKSLLPPEVTDELLSEVTVLKNNLEKIQTHSNSTTRILKDMQKLLKEKSRNFLETDLNSFLETKARSSMQERQSAYKGFTVELVLSLDNVPIRTKILPYELGQVIQDLISNSYYTLFEKSKQITDFLPKIHIITKISNQHVVVRVRDNGKGIPEREVQKLFSPFITTKPTSDGTGLGLFMVKDIIETHRGKIGVQTKEGEFTEIIMTLPIVTQY